MIYGNPFDHLYGSFRSLTLHVQKFSNMIIDVNIQHVT